MQNESLSLVVKIMNNLFPSGEERFAPPPPVRKGMALLQAQPTVNA